MDVFVEVDGDKVIVSASIITPQYVGDLIREIKPGESFGPLTYEQLKQHGNGHLQVDLDTQPGQ